MKGRFFWLGSLALATSLQLETQAAYTNLDGIIITNGVVVISTRSATDAYWRQFSSSGLWDADDNRGPGVFSPGDAAMAIVLQDYGYSTRMVPEKVLTYDAQDGSELLSWNLVPNDPLNYYNGGCLPSGTSTSASNVLSSAMLVIISGSGSSADMPPPNTNGIPIIMGEHSCLGDNTTGVPRDHSELFLYGNKNSGNANLSGWSGGGITGNPGLYMKVVATNHPIMQGIPLDSKGRVKIFRDPFPEENLHSTASAKPNYEISWTCVDCRAGKSTKAPGLTTIGTLDDPYPDIVVFAVMDAGGQIADTTDYLSPWFGRTNAPSRLVHFFVNEGGSGNTRRAFNALTDIGKIIFVRTCKWAMGEELAPYKNLGIIDVTLLTPKTIKLGWQGAASQNYRILAADNLFAGPTEWQTVAQDIPGADGLVSRTLDISAGPQYAFLKVAPMP